MVCKKCGAELRDGVKFCTQCGAKIEIEGITVQNNQAGPQGYSNQTAYGSQGSYNQQSYGQTPGYNNPPTPPYGPGGMNQGNYGYGAMPPQKKSSALPLILIIVAAAVAVVLIVFFVMRGRNGGNPDPNKNSGSGNVSSAYSSQNSGRSGSSAGKSSSSAGKSDQNSSSRSSSSARASSSQGKTSSASSAEPKQDSDLDTIVKGAKVVKNATLKDLEGVYEGEWTFTEYKGDAAMYGYDQEEFDKAVEILRSTSHDVELTYYDDGDWDFDVDGWMDIGADDFEADESAGVVLQGSSYIKEIKDGSFIVEVVMSQDIKDDPDYGTGTMRVHMYYNGVLLEKDGKNYIAGSLWEIVEMPKGSATFSGKYSAEKVKE